MYLPEQDWYSDAVRDNANDDKDGLDVDIKN